jgi:hypothetical protein
MKRRAIGSITTKKPRKKRVSKTRYLNLPEEHLRRWRTGDRTADGPGFWCKVVGQFTGLGKCAHGGCDPEGRKCPYFECKEAKEAVVEYHERTGKPVTTKEQGGFYEVLTNPDGTKKYKKIQYGRPEKNGESEVEDKTGEEVEEEVQ